MPANRLVVQHSIRSLHSRHQFNLIFDIISDGGIKVFVSQQKPEVYKSISAAVDLFD
jgi:hypothetical protein